MKNKPDDIYPRFKAAVALSGHNMGEIAANLGVSLVSLRQVARGYATSERLRKFMVDYIDQWLTAEVLKS